MRLAVRELATGSSRLQRRLEYAGLQFAPLPPDAFSPGRERALAEHIRAKLAEVSDEQKGSIVATTAALSDEDARVLATDFVNLYDSVAGFIETPGPGAH